MGHPEAALRAPLTRRSKASPTRPQGRAQCPPQQEGNSQSPVTGGPCSQSPKVSTAGQGPSGHPKDRTPASHQACRPQRGAEPLRARLQGAAAKRRRAAGATEARAAAR
ncbi:hypothetical protein NDU88_004612 [Pleurodeles waltl]|uniref:Uncharacterized protein n=1 Tax=Pleurodeles waltl TaxID=8319 RepID=A0AAV7W7Z2_PLEWA|nr:hypothetical protein NDU88_004612 [Pleurodeles waltl]